MKKVLVGLGMAMLLGGCSSTPLGSDGESEAESVAARLQNEVELSAHAAEQLRLVARLYVGDYAVLEWYQPLAGVIGFSVVQPGGYEPIDSNALRGLKPTQVFKRFAPNLQVPESLVKLEAEPEVLQELQDREVIERFLPEAELTGPGVVPQAAFRVSQGTAAFNCSSFSTFRTTYCDGWAGPRFCDQNLTASKTQRANNVDESQGTLCSVLGTNDFHITINGCQTAWGIPEAENACSGKVIAGAGTFFEVSQGIVRSWHGFAQTYWWGDDAYSHTTLGMPSFGTGRFHLGTRSFTD